MAMQVSPSQPTLHWQMSPSSNSYTTTHCSPSYMVKSSSLFRDLAQLEACLNFYLALY